MSIIHQALKKAQRERQLQTGQTAPQERRSVLRQRRRVPSTAFIAGSVLVLVVGTILSLRWYTADAPTRTTRHMPQPLPAQVQTRAIPSLTPVSRLSAPMVQPEPANTSRLQPSMSSTIPSTAAQTVQDLPIPPSAPQLPPTPEPSRPSQHTALPPTPSPQPLPVPATPAVPTAQARTTARALFKHALEARKTGDVERALTLLQQAVALNPTLKSAYNSLGNLYYQREQYHQALTMYQKALDLDPAYAKARNNLGSTYMQLAMHDQAIAALHQASRAASEAGLAYYNLACVYARTGESAKAAQYLRQAMQREPQALQWARSDSDFVQVRTTPVFRQLLGSSP